MDDMTAGLPELLGAQQAREAAVSRIDAEERDANVAVQAASDALVDLERAIFQVSVLDRRDRLAKATALATRVFDDALRTAGLRARTSKVAVVEGGDAFLLP